MRARTWEDGIYEVESFTNLGAEVSTSNKKVSVEAKVRQGIDKLVKQSTNVLVIQQTPRYHGFRQAQSLPILSKLSQRHFCLRSRWCVL